MVTALPEIIVLSILVANVVGTPSDRRLEQAFSGTIVSTYPDGRTALLWLDRNGTYQAKGRRRTPSSGTWVIKTDRICLKQRKPLPAPFDFCAPIPDGPVLISHAVTGEPISIVVSPDGRETASSK